MVGVVTRAGRYAAASCPPLAVALIVTWCLGETGLFAADDPRVSHWHPSADTLVATVTVIIDMLILRAIDDIRDVEYDRRHNPGRLLPRGSVRASDLAAMTGVGVLLMLVLNISDALALGILVTQFGYVAGTMAVHFRWQRPSGDNLLLGLAVSLPAPLLVQLYLYARYLNAAGLGPRIAVVLPLLTVTCARLHSEFSRKIVRNPAVNLRTYVHNFGFWGTVVVALGTAALALVLLFAIVHSPLALLGFVPEWWAILPAWRLWQRGARRWTPMAPTLYLLTNFTVYFIMGVLR